MHHNVNIIILIISLMMNVKSDIIYADIGYECQRDVKSVEDLKRMNEALPVIIFVELNSK